MFSIRPSNAGEESEASLSEAWMLPEGMLDALPDGVYFVDRDRTVTYWNAAASTISGFAPKEMLGHWCGDGLLSHVDDDGRGLCGERCPLLATIGDGEVRSARVMLHHRDGHMVPVEIRAAPMRDADGNIVGAIEMFRDDTARFAEEHRVRELDVVGGTDPLTGLGNRRSLEAHLIERLAALAHRQVPLGVLVCGVEDLRAVEESHGRDAADRMLMVIADTLVHCLPGRGRLFRYGADQFVGLVSRSDLAVFGTRLCAYVEDSRIGLEDDVLHATISVGATMAARGEDYLDVLRRAERLLSAASKAGGNCVVTDTDEAPAAS